MSTIGWALYYLFDIIMWMIFIKSIMTWIPNIMESDMGRRVYTFMYNVTEPIEGPVRSIMYKYNSGPVDFSPMITLLVLMLLKRIALILFI